MKNTVNLVGNLGMNPEITEFENGGKKVRFTLATNEFYTNKSGEKIQNTMWHTLFAFGSTANYIAKVATKGSQLQVRGRLVYETYKSKLGENKTISMIQVKSANKMN